MTDIVQATKALFSSAVLSLEPANIRALKLLAKSELRKHVKCFYLDTSTYEVPTVPQKYCKLASTYFSSVFAMGSQNTGPLSEDNLHSLLLADPYKPLGPGFLSGKPRRDFCAGYTLYSARGHYLRDFLGTKNKDLVKLLKQITSSFNNIKSVESIPHWTESEEPYQARFRLYLRSHLPQKTLNLIPGLNPRTKSNAEGGESALSAFAAPGVSARDLNVMMLAPNFGTGFHDIQMHWITKAVLCALKDNRMTLDSLSLPGPDFVGQICEANSRAGVVAADTLLGYVDNLYTGNRTGLLLPTLRNLKVLELNIDFKQTLRPGMLPPSRVKNRLRHAIQQMKALESLSLGSPISHLGDPDSWTLTDLLLWKKADYPEPDEDGLAPPPPGAPAFVNMLMNGFAGLMGMPGTGGPPTQAPPPPVQPGPAPPPATTPAADANGPAAGSNAGQGPAPAGNILAQLMGGGVGAINMQGNVIQQPLDMATVTALLSGIGLDELKATDIPKTPMDPNPWPNLEYLSLWNLPSYPEEISRLIKTVKSSLRTLKLSRVYFARPGATAEPDGGEADDFSNLFGPTHPANGALGGEPTASNDDSDEGDTSGVPDLVDLVEGGPYTLPDFAETSAGATSASYSASSGPGPGSTADSSGIPPSDVTGASEEDDSDSNTSEKWLSTIEMLAEELRLDACDFYFEEHDEAWLRRRLQKDMTEVPEQSLGKPVGPYLVKGDGMGFTMFLAQKHSEKSIKDDSAEAVEDVAAPMRLNTHVCSIWQACPNGLVSN